MLLGLILMGLLTCVALVTSKTYDAPSVVLCAIWSTLFGLQLLIAPSMYSSNLGTLVAAMLLASFLIGEWLGRALTRDPGPSLSARPGPVQERRLATIVQVFGALSLILIVPFWNALGFFELGGVQSVLLSIGRIRAEAFAGDIELPTASKLGFIFAYVGVVLSATYYVLYGWKWWLAPSTLAVATIGLSLSGKAGIVAAVLQWLSAIVLRDRITGGGRSHLAALARRILLTGLLLTLLFILSMALRSATQDLNEAFLVNIAPFFETYLFGGISAFSYYVDHRIQWFAFNFGRYSFASLMDFLGIFQIHTGIYSTEAPVTPDGQSVNIYTALRSFIDDFSIFGAVAVFVLAGTWLGLLHRKFQEGRGHVAAFLIPAYSWLVFSPMASLTYFNSFLASLIVPSLLLRMAGFKE